jgi:hypothetical protein
MGWKKGVNDSAHCLESVALTSREVDHKSLVIQPPCTWNWGKGTCDDCTADRMPRVTFNGQKVTCTMNKWIELAPGLRVHCRVNRVQVKGFTKSAPVAATVAFWGGRGFEKTKVKTCTAGTHGSLHFWMNRNQFGPQCGHCGDFDGNDADDRIYDKKGVMTKSKRALCDADVKDCQSLFLSPMTPTRYNSNGYVVPEDDSLCGCAPENACKDSGETRVNVQQACATSYEKVCKAQATPLQEVHKAFFEECMEDVCNGGTAFTDVDVGDESESDCSENDSMEDDAVCNHCVREAPAAAASQPTPTTARVACENPRHPTMQQCTMSKMGRCHGRVRMGHDKRWTAWKPIDGQFPCTNAWFNEDPAKGQAKECICESTS